MDSDILKLIGVIVVIFVLLGWAVNALSSVSCYATTKGMRVVTEYTFLAGCLVSTPDGRMVPLDVYREFKQQP